MRGDVEPQAKSARGPPIAVAAAENSIGGIEFEAVEPLVFADMRLVGIGGDGNLLQRHRDLRRGDAYRADAPTLWDVDFQTAVAQAELVDREVEGAWYVVVSGQWYLRNGGRDPALREELLARGRELGWYPRSMRPRYEDWVRGLTGDWIISRQRFFGVPIPLWYRVDTDGIPVYRDPLPPADSVALVITTVGTRSYSWRFNSGPTSIGALASETRGTRPARTSTQ